LAAAAAPAGGGSCDPLGSVPAAGSTQPCPPLAGTRYAWCRTVPFGRVCRSSGGSGVIWSASGAGRARTVPRLAPDAAAAAVPINAVQGPRIADNPPARVKPGSRAIRPAWPVRNTSTGVARWRVCGSRRHHLSSGDCPQSRSLP